MVELLAVLGVRSTLACRWELCNDVRPAHRNAACGMIAADGCPPEKAGGRYGVKVKGAHLKVAATEPTATARAQPRVAVPRWLGWF